MSHYDTVSLSQHHYHSFDYKSLRKVLQTHDSSVQRIIHREAVNLSIWCLLCVRIPVRVGMTPGAGGTTLSCLTSTSMVPLSPVLVSTPCSSPSPSPRPSTSSWAATSSLLWSPTPSMRWDCRPGIIMAGVSSPETSCSAQDPEEMFLKSYLLKHSAMINQVFSTKNISPNKKYILSIQTTWNTLRNKNNFELYTA